MLVFDVNGCVLRDLVLTMCFTRPGSYYVFYETRFLLCEYIQIVVHGGKYFKSFFKFYVAFILLYIWLIAYYSCYWFYLLVLLNDFIYDGLLIKISLWCC